MLCDTWAPHWLACILAGFSAPGSRSAQGSRAFNSACTRTILASAFSAPMCSTLRRKDMKKIYPRGRRLFSDVSTRQSRAEREFGAVTVVAKPWEPWIITGHRQITMVAPRWWRHVSFQSFRKTSAGGGIFALANHNVSRNSITVAMLVRFVWV